MTEELILDTPEKVNEFARQWRIKMDEDARQIAMLMGDMPITYRDLEVELEGMQFDHQSFPDDTKEFFQDLDKILSMMGVKTGNTPKTNIYSPYSNPLTQPLTQNPTPQPNIARNIRRFI